MHKLNNLRRKSVCCGYYKNSRGILGLQNGAVFFDESLISTDEILISTDKSPISTDAGKKRLSSIRSWGICETFNKFSGYPITVTVALNRSYARDIKRRFFMAFCSPGEVEYKYIASGQEEWDELLQKIKYIEKGTQLKDACKAKIRKPFIISNKVITHAFFYDLMNYDTQSNAYQDSERTPITGLNVFEMLEFCNELSILSGLEPCYSLTNIQKYEIDNMDHRTEEAKVSFVNANGYRLPTEQELIYALKAEKVGFFNERQIEVLKAKRQNAWGLWLRLTKDDLWEVCLDSESFEADKIWLRGGKIEEGAMDFDSCKFANRSFSTILGNPMPVCFRIVRNTSLFI